MLHISESDTKYGKFDKHVRDIDDVDQNLADAILDAIGDKD